ncbi:MAG: SH3 domain-containing protein [Candidatus Aminicenantales bacterium]
MRKSSLFGLITGLVLFCLLTQLVGAADLGADGIKLRVAAEQANIREKPDITSPLLQQLPEGAILEAERKEGEWFAVLVEKAEGGAVIGYVHESLVVVLEAKPAEPPGEEQAEETKTVRERPAQKPAEPVKEEPHFVPPPVRPASAAALEEDRLAVAFWLGGRYAAVGDLNDGSKGLARYYETRLAAAGEGDVEALHFSYLLGAEVRLPLAFGFYLCLGTEYGSGETASSVFFVEGSQEVTFETKPRVRAIPISLSLVYYPMPVLYLKAGVDYTFARCGYSYRLTEADPRLMTESWQEWTGEAGSSGFGYLAGLGFDWNLASRVSLTAEAVYRHSRLADLGGKDVYKESSAYESIEEGKLYYIEVDTGTAEVVPLVFVREKRPAEAGVISVRKAELDLSGFCLKLGIRIGL